MYSLGRQCVRNYSNASDQQHNLHHVHLEHVALPYVIFKKVKLTELHHI